MKIKLKINRDKSGNDKDCPKCNYEASYLYRLDGWDRKDGLCGECFAQELLDSEADYQVTPKRLLK